tara:strand:- start:39 stop:218 length:180 start_codon:yes stop_codon:yes gene_type:complete
MFQILLVFLCLAAIADAGSPVTDGQSCSAEGGGFQCIDSRKMVSIPPASALQYKYIKKN